MALHAMFFHAHPDDESSKGAGTMARYVKEGYRVSVLTFTDGSKGDLLNPAMDRPGIRDRIVDVRREELAEALRILGVSEHYDLGYADSGYVEDFRRDGTALDPAAFWNVALDEVVARVVPLLRSTRPDVVVTYDENGGYPHPDHIRTHDASIAALAAAEDAAQLPEAGAPHRVRKVYYTTAFNLRRVEALHTACESRGLESPYAEWLAGWDRSQPERFTTSIDVGDFIATRHQALRAHATQVDPEGRWFSLPDEAIRDVYPWEDYELARSDAPTELPEDSLFAGLE